MILYVLTTHLLILNIKWPPLSPTCSPWHSGDINSHIVQRNIQKTRLNNEPGLLAYISFMTLTRTLNLSIVLSCLGLSFSFIAPSSRWVLRDLLPSLVFWYNHSTWIRETTLIHANLPNNKCITLFYRLYHFPIICKYN